MGENGMHRIEQIEGRIGARQRQVRFIVVAHQPDIFPKTIKIVAINIPGTDRLGDDVIAEIVEVVAVEQVDQNFGLNM